jgi:membrane protease YdiL (CAAX protease family)
VGGIIAVFANQRAVDVAVKMHLVAGDLIAKGLNEAVACPQFFKELKEKALVQVDPSLPLEMRNAVANFAFFVSAIFVPVVIEEVLFRGIVQDIALKRVPFFVLKKVMPGKETLLQTKIYTVARVVVTSSFFCAYHLLNNGSFSDSYIQLQLPGTFAVGIVFGVIKETRLGLGISIISHATHNGLATMPCFALVMK